MRSNHLHAAALLLACACRGGESEVIEPFVAQRAAVAHASDMTPAILVPAGPGANAPARMTIVGSGENISAIGQCSDCHADAAAQWRESAHSFSSFSNPMYRASVEAFREARGPVASRFCASCHDPALLADSAMDEEIDAADSRAHVGITCVVCHGATAATVDGNGSLTIDATRLIIPSNSSAEAIARHRASVKPLSGVELCASCHRSFLDDDVSHPAFLTGMDDFGAWKESGYAASGIARPDAVEPATCRDCHMPPEQATRGDVAARGGVIRSHRFAGGHSHMAAMRGHPEQLAAIRRLLRGRVTVDIAAVRGDSSGWHWPAQGAAVQEDGVVEFDVVLRNLGVGHKFPGGTADAQDSWLEAVVRDGRGRLIASSGAEHDRKSEPGVHRFRSVVLGDDGVPRELREVSEFRAVLRDHTIPPRGARVARFSFSLPEDVKFPLRLKVRLMHRSRNHGLVQRACSESKTIAGRAFAAGAVAAGLEAVDGCAPAPIVVIGEAEASLGSATVAAKLSWRSAYDHGEALLEQIQERVEEARAPLELAWQLAGSDGERARVAVATAKLEGRLGRFDAAQRWATRARALGAGPSADAALAAAAARVWRWDVAAEAWARVTRTVPGSVSALRGLAIAAGSTTDDRRALGASARGLLQFPRDSDLLRVQAVASRALSLPASAAAEQAFERYRSPDDATRLRLQCARAVPGCADERLPIPVRRMRQHVD